MSEVPNVSIADLSAAGVRLRPFEAVTVARAVARQVIRGELPGVPSAHVLRFNSEGHIGVEGPVEAGGRAVPRLAQLLDTLLPGFDAPPEYRVPGALRLVVARALHTLDLPPYPSLQSFDDALVRFSASAAEPIVRGLVATFLQQARPSVPPDEVPAAPQTADAAPEAEVSGTLARMDASATALTISDIRRARRATGLTLSDVSARSRIPAWLLRELEWGYFRNWPAGHYGRTQLIRYARAAGLDDQLVVRTVWPLVGREARTEGRAVVPAMEWTEPVEWREGEILPDEAAGTADVPLARAESRTAPPPRRRRAALAALAIPALLAIGLLPGILQRSASQGEPVAAESASTAQEGTAPSLSEPLSAPRAADVPERAPSDEPPMRGNDARPADPPAPETTRAAAPEARQDTKERPVGEGTAYSPAFASVGTAMFYHTAADGQSALMRADADSQGAILRVTSVVDDDASNFHPRPSPDGTRIAFDSDREGERAVFVADADGGNVRRVSAEGFAAIPSWSPDGHRLAYVRSEPGRPQVWNLWMTDLRTGETRRVTSYRVGQPWGASWFPDGRRIAYSHETRLIVRDLESGAERVFQSPVKGRLVRTPAVSPDGRRIMFQVHRDGAWLLHVPDGSMRKVLSDPTAEEYTWAPDGRRVAYHSRQSGAWGVWVMASR